MTTKTPLRLLRTTLMAGSFAMAMAGHVVAAAAQPALDYSTVPFSTERLLDWGTRPDWSPDGKRIAFTESEVANTPAHEIDLKTRAVRCLTCHLGPAKDVTRVYYLPDKSFLILAPKRANPDGTRPFGQELYWMPASLGPLQPLDAQGFGEIAISHEPAADGAVKIAWGDATNGNSLLLLATLHISDGKAALRDRRTLYDVHSPATPPGMTVAEAYGFAHGDKAVTFYTILEKGDILDDEMVEVDLESGRITSLYSDPAHTETHLFPDERYGLEEGNRASDPDGKWRGISSHPANFIGFMAKRVKMPLPTPADLADYAPHGRNKGFDRPFDLFVVRLDGSAPPRRLTDMGDFGATARQSVIAPDGRRIAYAVDPRSSPEMAGKGGLYLGQFGKAP